MDDLAKFQYGLNEIAKEKGNIVYIRITDIDRYGLLKKDNLAYLNYKDKYKNYKLKKGDILIARIGATFGKSYYFNENFDAVFAGYLIKIKLLSNEICPKYLFYFFQTKYFWKQAKKLVKGGAQPQFNANTLKNLLIPILPLKTQNRIVQIMDNAYKTKKQKETEAQQLLNSINDYVLSELGIKIPELKDQSTFLVCADDVKGKRIDPRCYKPFFLKFENELMKRKDIKYFGEISKYIGSGATPKAGGSDYTTKEEGVPFIRIVNLKNNTIVLDEHTLYIKRNIHEGMLKRTQLKPNDVLLTMAGTIGLSVVVPENLEEANINQAIARIVLKENANPFFVSAVLNSPIGKIQTDRYSRPSVQANINLEEIRKLKIPFPPLEIQNKIADEVKRRMGKAEQLQEEAKEVLEKAKREVEDIILSGENNEG